MFSAAVFSLLLLGAIGDMTEEAYAADPDTDSEDETEFIVEPFDLTFAAVMILSLVVLTLYRKKK